MADLKKCLCIDVGGTAIKYGLIDAEVNLTDKGEVPTPYDGVEAYLDVLERLYRGVEDKVQGIAMSVPGVIDSENGICVSGGNLRFIENFNLAGELGRRVKVPVTVMNDAKSAAMAEARWGALADCRDGVVIVLGTGIGGALIKDGRVHFGKNFAAGEFSFITMGRTWTAGITPGQVRREIPGSAGWWLAPRESRTRRASQALTYFGGPGRGTLWCLWRWSSLPEGLPI